MYKLGIDIGGTFTDLVLLDARTSKRYVEKILTTPHDPSIGAINGVKNILKSVGISAGELRYIIHGTTLVANAIIERKGCRTGLIVTEGFRDILEMRRGRRFDMDDLFIEVPDPLVPRSFIGEAVERMNKDGDPLIPINESTARDAIASLIERGVESIGICFLHSYRNPEHEIQVGKLAQSLDPGLAVSLSSDVAPVIREYERASTTAANAYVKPLMRQYIARLEDNLSGLGYAHKLYLMLSDAGLTTGDIAREYPIRLIESGPVGGAVAARYFGNQRGSQDLVAFDMGGTTAKISFISSGEIQFTSEMEVARRYRFKGGSGLPIHIPAVAVIEIGAGGGGIASIDDVGLLKVGPQSAGADPGPACYNLGGTTATVTDANLLLGYLDAGYFLGGAMPLSREAAEGAIKRTAAPLDLSMERAAWGIHEIVTEDMAQAARMHLLERGADPRGFVLFAFGGAGPLHACRLAQKLGMKQVVVPFGAGVASAFGFLVAPISITLLQAYPSDLNRIDIEHLRAVLTRLEEQARIFLKDAGVSTPEITIRGFASLKYSGQGVELRVPLPERELAKQDMATLAEQFHAEFERVYGRNNKGIPVEAQNWLVVASGERPEVGLPSNIDVVQEHKTPTIMRRAYFPETEGFMDCPVVHRMALSRGTRMEGPLLVQERESTTVVTPGAQLEVDMAYNLCITLSS